MTRLDAATLACRLRWTAPLLGLVCLLPQLGCSEYRISMRPRGESIERTLSRWKGQSPEVFEEEMASRLEQAYGVELDADATSATTRFSGATPQDIGGAGSYTRYRTPLGNASVYLERFRGNDELNEPIREIHDRLGRSSELLARWLGEELGEDPAAEVLQRFVRGPLRGDLENLALYSFSSNLLEDGKTSLARMLQYLVERDYLEVVDLPRIARGLENDERGLLAGSLARLAARQLGVSDEEPLPETLGFLADPERLERSLETFARSTPEFRSWVEAHPEVAEDERLDAWMNAVLLPLPPDFLASGATHLRIDLELAAPPVVTNGVWDAEAGRIRWDSRPLPDPDRPPAFAFALWAEPVAAFQEEHLGGVVLDGEALWNYAFAYAGLTPGEVSEWDAFVASLGPGSDLAASIRGFRFSDEPLDPEKPADEQPATRAEKLVTLLHRAVAAPPS